MTIRLIILSAILCTITAITGIVVYRSYHNVFAQSQTDPCLESNIMLLQRINTVTNKLLNKLQGLTSNQSISKLSQYASQLNKIQIQATIKGQENTALVAQCVTKNIVTAISTYKTNINADQETIYRKISGLPPKIESHSSAEDIKPIESTPVIDENTTATELAQKINSAIDTRIKKAIIEQFIQVNNNQINNFAKSL